MPQRTLDSIRSVGRVVGFALLSVCAATTSLVAQAPPDCPEPAEGVPGTPPPLLDEAPSPGVHHIAHQAPKLRDVPGAVASLDREYPPDLRAQGVGGTTSVWFLIDAVGTTQDVAVARTSGNETLDRAAMAAGRAFVFESAEHRCAPMMWVVIPVTFTPTGR